MVYTILKVWCIPMLRSKTRRAYNRFLGRFNANPTRMTHGMSQHQLRPGTPSMCEQDVAMRYSAVFASVATSRPTTILTAHAWHGDALPACLTAMLAACLHVHRPLRIAHRWADPPTMLRLISRCALNARVSRYHTTCTLYGLFSRQTSPCTPDPCVAAAAPRRDRASRLFDPATPSTLPARDDLSRGAHLMSPSHHTTRPHTP